MKLRKIISLIIRKYKQELTLAILICIYIAYFTTASFLRYDNFYTGRFDLGNMDQTVWNTINGRIFQASNDEGIIISRLSYHADFILILLSPFYIIWSHPKTLLLIQSLVLGIGGVFVFLIAKNILQNKNFAVIFSFLFLINPGMQFTNLYDFHAVTLSTTFLLSSFYFLIKQKYFLLIIFLVLSGITKEQVWIITSLFGFPLLFQKVKKIRFLGAGIILFSFGIFAYLIWLAIPQNLGREHFALSYFSDFGNSPFEVIKTVLFSPQKIFLTIFEGNRIEYLKQLFMPVGFFPIVSPLYLIFAIPDLLINLLSSNAQLHQIYYQYSATITPFIIISSIFGVELFLKLFPKIKIYLALYLIFFAVFSAYSFGPLPLAKNPNIDMFIKPQPNKEIIENFLSKIPEEYSVAATNNLGSHLSQRERISTIPLGIDKADAVVFLLTKEKIPDDLTRNRNYIEVFRIDDFVAFKKRTILL